MNKEIINQDNMDSRVCNKCGQGRSVKHCPYPWNGKEYLCPECQPNEMNEYDVTYSINDVVVKIEAESLPEALKIATQRTIEIKATDCDIHVEVLEK